MEFFREQCGHFWHDKKSQYFLWDQFGATSIEYALIAGFLSILIIAGVNGIGTTVKGTFRCSSLAV